MQDIDARQAELAAKVSELAEARQRVERQKQAVAAAQAALDATHEAVYLATQTVALSEAARERDNLEAAVRLLAVECFKLTGEKKPTAGVEVVMRSQVKIDETKAFEYALQKLPQALRLDKRAFGKLIRSMPEGRRPDFVEITEVPAARIASNLAAACAEAGEVGP